MPAAGLLFALEPDISAPHRAGGRRARKAFARNTIMTPGGSRAIRLPLPLSEPIEQPALIWLGAEVDAELDRVEEAHRDAEHWRLWRELSLLLDALPTISWQMRQGVFVSDVARWVHLAMARGQAQQRLLDVFWVRSPAGRALLEDFAALRAYLQV
ncbi:MAG: hypothetical protein QM758_10750 [Armatimonas sp.]